MVACHLDFRDLFSVYYLHDRNNDFIRADLNTSARLRVKPPDHGTFLHQAIVRLQFLRVFLYGIIMQNTKKSGKLGG